MRVHTLLSVAIWAVASTTAGVGASGWKPIPPPRGHFKANHEPHVYSSHTSHSHPSDEYRSASILASSLDSPRVGGDSQSTAEIFFNSPSHGFKYTADLTGHKPSHDLDSIFKKEPLKTYKPHHSSISSSPSFGDKGSPFSYHSYNGYKNRKPIKVGFYEKPEPPAVFNEFVKHEDFPVKHHSFIENEIKPFSGGHLSSYEDRQCSLYKVAFRQDLYFQYIQYKVQVPDLKEFTLCMWSKYSNHSNDHPLFSYAVRNQPRAVYVWVSTTDRSNYFNMAINGHPIFRLNYPIRLNRWYHTCSSWNGKTGEWQVWVNAERIGRGFHNLLVGHKIPGGGIAITGQEQRQLGGGFIEGPDAPKGSGGFLGEVTMLQLYRVALTAGKAFNDHRHHHSLKASSTPEPPAPPPQEELPTTEHPFLENGQLKHKIPVFELAESLRTQNNQDQPMDAQLPIGGGIGNLDLFNNPFAQTGFYSLEQPILTPFMVFSDHGLFKRGNDKQEDTRSKRNGDKSEGNVGASSDMKIKFVPTPQQVHVDKVKFDESSEIKPENEEQNAEEQQDTRQKREFVLVDEDKEEPEENTRESRRLRRPVRQNHYGNHGMRAAPRPHRTRRPTPAMRKQEPELQPQGAKQQQAASSLASEEQDLQEDGTTSKRQVFLGDFGFSHFTPREPVFRKPQKAVQPQLEEEDDGPIDPIEPAEGEVRRIMGVCGGCDPDPFRKVAIISWRSAPKKIYSGALFLKARPECRRF